MPSEFSEIIPLPKVTGSHADAFAAAGIADILASVFSPEHVRIVEQSGAFEVHLPARPTVDDLRRIPRLAGYPFLKPNAKTGIPKGVTDVVDYKVEKEKADRLKEVIKATGKAKRTGADAQMQELIQQEQLRDDWQLLRILNTLQGDGTTNDIHATVVTRDAERFRDEVGQALKALCGDRPSGLDWPARTVQLFTPTAAKGYSRLKPDSTDRNDKTKDKWADPFIEWARYRGYFRIACPYFQGQKAESVRLLCPVPHDISIGALCAVARELRSASVYGGAPKLDSLAALKLAELLIAHSEEFHDPDEEIFPGLRLQSKSPASAISGVAVTHYQSLGNAKAVSAMSVLALPGWFSINSHEDADLWRAMLAEQQRIVRVLKEDHSDEIGLLIQYRRFMQHRGAGAAWALVEFLESYGPFIMRKNGNREGNRIRWVPRVTDYHFRRILMGTSEKLVSIVDDLGFDAIARAVREATVTAQNRKARNQDPGREIRYELLHDIHRTRKVPGGAFVERICEFISRYNYENARRREMRKDLRAAPPNVSDEELKSFIRLVDKHGASTVGALLAAYSSCKVKWEGEAEPEEATAEAGSAE